MRGLWAKLKRIARKTRELFPLTFLGFVLLAAAGVGTWWFGFVKMDLVVLAMGAVTVGVGAIALVAVPLTAIVLYRALRKKATSDSLRLECGMPMRTGFSASSLWFLPLVEVKWTWREPRAKAELVRSKGRLWETVTAARRGTFDGVARRVEVKDAFGLTKITFELFEPRSVSVLPSQGMLRHMHAVRTLARGDDFYDPLGAPEGDRLDLRNYVPGDPVRFILWRVFAKTRQVVVRTPERSLAHARKALAYLVADENDEPAAGAARVAIECNALGSDWTFGADGVEEHATTKQKAVQLVNDSARAKEDVRGAGLGNFLKRHGTGAGSRALVFVPGKKGPWLDRVAAGARASGVGAQVEFVVCVDGILPPTGKGWQSKLRDDSVDDGEPETWVSVPQDELEEVVSRLATGARSRVLLADRRAGRVFDAAALRVGLGTRAA